MYIKLKFFITALLVLGFAQQQNIKAQSVPVAIQFMEDDLRRQQTDAGILLDHSFTIRPLYHIHIQNDSFYSDETSIHHYQKKIKAGVLPVSELQQYNSNLPYGYNDAVMIPAKGYQTFITGGFYASYWHLEAQFKPEIVFAANPYFPTYTSFTRTHSEIVNFYAWNNKMDQPERFGTGTYTKAVAGQSYLRLRFGKAAFGISDENLWWGPGIRNALMMTNNSPGIPHLFLQTTAPVKTAIGSFEANLILGRMQRTLYYSYDTSFRVNNQKLFKTKPDQFRYMNGLVLTYQPKWLPGLFLGFTRMFTNNVLNTKAGFINTYIPALNPQIFAKNNNLIQDSVTFDQMASVFFRLVLPPAKMEVYMEYGRNDHSWDLKDLFLQPEHSNAYIVGVKKIFDFKNNSRKLELLFELTRIETPKTYIIRASPSWYIHQDSKDQYGYTQMGKIIGAGIGSGGDAQTIQATIFNKRSSYGWMLERVVHDNDFFYQTYKDPRKEWVDLTNSFFYNRKFKQFKLFAKLSYTAYFNYEWGISNINPNSYWDYKGNDLGDLQIQWGMTFYLK